MTAEEFKKIMETKIKKHQKYIKQEEKKRLQNLDGLIPPINQIH